MKKTPEGQVKKAILEYLRFIPNCCVFPIVTAGVFDPTRKLFRTNKIMRLGTPDILLCIDGYFVAIEVKAPKGRLSPHQDLVLKDIEQAKGFALVARSVDDVIEFMKKNGFDSRV